MMTKIALAATAGVALIAVTAQALPPGQQAVCDLLNSYAARYKPLYDTYYKEENGVAKDRIAEQSKNLRRERDGALNSLVRQDGFKLGGWCVMIDEINTSNKYYAATGTQRYVSMMLNPHCGISVQIEARETLLTPDLEADLATRKTGQEITISGNFFKLDADKAWPGWGLASRLSESGAMTTPKMNIENWRLTP